MVTPTAHDDGAAGDRRGLGTVLSVAVAMSTCKAETRWAEREMERVSIAADVPDDALIARAADVLRRGGIVAYPTDTFYGLAVDPRRDDAVARLYAAKGRDASMAIPLIAASLAQAEEAAVVGDRELRLARAFWPGPLTIVMPPSGGNCRADAR